MPEVMGWDVGQRVRSGITTGGVPFGFPRSEWWFSPR